MTPEFPAGTYYYVITPTFPFIPRYWQGEPGPDFGHPMGGNQTQGPRPGAGPGNRARGPAADAFPALTLLRDASFMSSLDLSPAKSSGLSAALREIETSMRQSRPTATDINPDDRRGQRLAMIAAIEPQIEVARRQWLTPAQNHDLLLQADIRANLQISDTQFASIYQAIIYSRSPYSISLSWAEVGDLLNESQRQGLQELVGPLD